MPLTPAAALRFLPASLALACGLALALPAAGQEPSDSALDPVRFGPPDIRDEHLLAQPRLTLPAVSPDPIGPGIWEVRLSTLWSNSFAWAQDVPGEHPSDRRFLIDGEAATLDATIRRGLTPDLDVALRIPLRWRGGGALDSFIDLWHRIFHLPDASRPLFLHDAFRVEGLTTAGMPFSLTGTGFGLGNLELDARWRFRDGGAEAVSAALVVRASVPTGTDPFGGDGFGGGASSCSTRPSAGASTSTPVSASPPRTRGRWTASATPRPGSTASPRSSGASRGASRRWWRRTPPRASSRTSTRTPACTG